MNALDRTGPHHTARLNGALVTAVPDVLEFVVRAIRDAGSLYTFAERHPKAELFSGRGRTYAIPAPPGEWIIRRYHRGGLAAAWLGDRYLRAGVARPLRELGASLALQARGIPTPPVLATAIYPTGAFYRAEIATLRVPNASDLSELLFGAFPSDGAARASALRATGMLLRRLHEHGVVHPDLNVKNVLVRGDGAEWQAYLIDLDRCRVGLRTTPRQRAAMLRRFWRSVTKWERHTGGRLEPSERAAFEAGYQAPPRTARPAVEAHV
jgi:tRNA A-37 threonylcarbamoyl transferase component Bud32